MVSFSGLLPPFRAVLKGRFVFQKGRGRVHGFLKTSVNTRAPAAGCRSIGSRFPFWKGGGTTGICFFLPPSLSSALPPFLLFSGFNDVFLENFAFLETANQEIRRWETVLLETVFSKGQMLFSACLFGQGLTVYSSGWPQSLNAGTSDMCSTPSSNVTSYEVCGISTELSNVVVYGDS